MEFPLSSPIDFGWDKYIAFLENIHLRDHLFEAFVVSVQDADHQACLAKENFFIVG